MNPNVVVAMGDVNVASTTCDLLRQEGYDVSSTVGSAEALARIASARPWLMVVGERLQDGEGDQLLRNVATTIPVEHLPSAVLIYAGMPTHAYDGPSWIHLADLYIAGPIGTTRIREFQQFVRRLRHGATRLPVGEQQQPLQRALVRAAARLRPPATPGV